MNDTFLKACRGEPVDYTPMWIMRQAGRYLPQYMKYHDKMGFMGMAKDPEVSAIVTVQPIDEFGMDAAILFSDILTTAEPMGAELVFAKGGPVFTHPIRTQADVDALTVFNPEEGLPYVYETVRILKKELANKVPLIGFAGTPFTVGAYMAEGSATQLYFHIRRLLSESPAVAHGLLEKLTQLTIAYVTAQVKHGAQAVMLFDNSSRVLTPELYATASLPYVKRCVAAIQAAGVPAIYYVNGTAALINEIKKAGADVVGIDNRLRLDRAIEVLGPNTSVQGNLDPFALLMPPAEMEKAARQVLDYGKAARGHIFNLGDGIFPAAPVENVRRLVDIVHRLGRK